jgi:broad specificity phosphatase PhoE
MSATFLICRHGETEYNAEGKLQGWFDTPLTEAGIKNAHAIASKLRGWQLDTIASSDLGRAFMSAYIIARDIGYNKEIVRAPELREVSFGDFDGQLEKDVADFYRKLKDALDYVPSHGEALSHMQTRVLKYVRALANPPSNTQILLVTHDCVINALYASHAQVDFGKYNTDHTNDHDTVIQMQLDPAGRITQFTRI